MRLGQKLGAALAEAERLAARALHLPREKIHTPISAMNGNHETSSDTNQGTSFGCGRAVIETPLP